MNSITVFAFSYPAVLYWCLDFCSQRQKVIQKVNVCPAVGVVLCGRESCFHWLDLSLSSGLCVSNRRLPLLYSSCSFTHGFIKVILLRCQTLPCIRQQIGPTALPSVQTSVLLVDNSTCYTGCKDVIVESQSMVDIEFISSKSCIIISERCQELCCYNDNKTCLQITITLLKMILTIWQILTKLF